MQRALDITRSRFADWYQAVVRDADMAETSPVRGAMVIKPWGYGVWEQIQQELDRRIKATGHENCYFPMFIPLSFIAKEADHVEGFAKEMAVVTHHRLKNIDGKLVPDPDAKLEEPLVVRPTSETIIGDAFARWITQPPRPAAADQPVGQCGALGNAAAPVPAHHRSFSGRRATPPMPAQGRSGGRDDEDAGESTAPSPKIIWPCR